MFAVMNKKELADYLKKNDPEMLDAIKEISSAFGPLETVVYVRHAPRDKDNE